ncbi:MULTISPECIES: hypothetical protein [unclassified Caulobacter]|jgi:hypothetical protein|uniref:hypothetical protein n=1 Tax=unclassified Caulobacter TaxID=2648921 RepID=UPI000C149C81|nr:MULTISPECIES: hypothetical protein [unclassified Caulobacter]MBQ1562859.1 hypothetical protein [Caulobacter sp.]MCK5908678.1 hypothetical protein [Caulobacter sp.]PIB96247.1 hypothetical protein CSW60_17080 [Caulobacter sp. X]
MIARSATPPAREAGAFKGRRCHPHGLAAIEIARPRQVLARLSPRTGRACGIEIGAGWRGGGRVKGQGYVGLTLAHPDIG